MDRDDLVASLELGDPGVQVSHVVVQLEREVHQLHQQLVEIDFALLAKFPQQPFEVLSSGSAIHAMNGKASREWCRARCFSGIGS